MGDNNYSDKSFKSWFDNDYTIISIFVIFCVAVFIFSLFFRPFWGNNIYPEEAYKLLEQVATDTINVQSKNIDFNKIPQEVKYSVTHKKDTTVYDKLHITCRIISTFENTTVKYILPAYGGIMTEENPEYTVQLDKDFNIIKSYRDSSPFKFHSFYWVMRIIGSAVITILVLGASFIVLLIYVFILSLIEKHQDKTKEKIIKEYEEDNKKEDDDDEDDDEINE